MRFGTIIFIFFVFLRTAPAFTQVYGCTDTEANNYNSSATLNDGTCTYNNTFYSPPLVVDTLSFTIKESSGLQWAGNSLWSFNDRGGLPQLYRIDTTTGAILQTVSLTGATNIDWEEVTFDSTYLYVGDFGNNEEGSRTDLKVYKFPFSAIPDYIENPIASIPADQIEVINFSYSDQPQPPVAVGLDSTKFDCEAMLVTDGKIHLFTKGWIDLTSTHYVINGLTAGTYIATPVETIKTGYLVTAAAKDPGKEVVTLLGYQNFGFGDHFISILSDYSDGKYFNGNKRKINLPDASVMGQAEGITFRNDNYGYISNERFKRSVGTTNVIVDQKLRSFNIFGLISTNLLATELKNFTATKVNGVDKITWSFSIPVRKLELQQSNDGINFTILKTYTNVVEGSFDHAPENIINYYRLAWVLTTGDHMYSKVLSLKNEQKDFINGLFLNTNGELSFMLSGDQPKSLSFKLLASDGKELSQVNRQSYNPGYNQIKFPVNGISSHIVLLSVLGTRKN